MKKILVIVLAATMAVNANAQKKNIQSALNSLRHKEFDKAIEYINLAAENPTTKENPKTWFTMGNIYMNMQQDPGYQADKPFKKAVEPYTKLVNLDPKYEAAQVKQSLKFCAFEYYNEGVKAYGNKQYAVAYDAAMNAVAIHDLNDGSYFTGDAPFDTIAAAAQVVMAYSAFYDGKTDQALPALLTLKDNPIEGNANIYLIISDVYRKKGDLANELAIIEEAKSKYPSDKNVRNEELNYYIRTNQQDKLMQKLEEAVSSDPENPIYQYNLANAYTNMVFPKDAEEGTQKPENYKELLSKAEVGYTKAIEKDADNMGYRYDMAVLYFNQASEVTEQMNEITGTTAEDDKKYEDLKAVRDEFFKKAFPYLEKVYTTLEPKVNSLDADNMFIYQSAIIALREIYARQSDYEKAKEMKKKLEESKMVK